MDIENFLKHHHLIENPFGAEEARYDSVFERLLNDSHLNHPDFPKILGQINRPSAAVVFGEKGSGKTAIRLLMEKLIEDYNREHPTERCLVVAYDDLNPVLDQFIQRQRASLPVYRMQKAGIDQLLEAIKLQDHQDAILSRAITRLVGGLISQKADHENTLQLPDDLDLRLKKLPHRLKVNLLVLVALYDQPRSGDPIDRWTKLKSKLRVKWQPQVSMIRPFATIATIITAGIAGIHYLGNIIASLQQAVPEGYIFVGGITAAIAIVLWAMLLGKHFKLWRLARNVFKQTPTIARSTQQFRAMLLNLKSSDLASQPWPVQGAGDGNNSRYQLTANLLEILNTFDYTGLTVLVDRADEPTVVSGQPERMRTILWPMFDNKFLQQDHVGIKLLLPVELRHMLHRESAEFFQEARLDKQNMIDRLVWSGVTIYDLCSERLRACLKSNTEAIYLTDLFESDVSREMLVDALDQMHQPRDAFKFLYSVIQEHCRSVPDDQATYLIPKLTLESVRRNQAQRVQDLYRGVSPA